MGESLDGVFFGFSSGVLSLFISLSFGESGSRWDIRIFSSLSSGEEMSGLITEGARFLIKFNGTMKEELYIIGNTKAQ